MWCCERHLPRQLGLGLGLRLGSGLRVGVGVGVVVGVGVGVGLVVLREAPVRLVEAEAQLLIGSGLGCYD